MQGICAESGIDIRLLNDSQWNIQAAGIEVIDHIFCKSEIDIVNHTLAGDDGLDHRGRYILAVKENTQGSTVDAIIIEYRSNLAHEFGAFCIKFKCHLGLSQGVRFYIRIRQQVCTGQLLLCSIRTGRRCRDPGWISTGIIYNISAGIKLLYFKLQQTDSADSCNCLTAIRNSGKLHQDTVGAL